MAAQPILMGNPTDTSPGSHVQLVTPSDVNDLTWISRALYIGATGNMQVTTMGGETVTLTGMGVGWHPLRVTRVWATGTTATGIVAVA